MKRFVHSIQKRSALWIPNFRAAAAILWAGLLATSAAQFTPGEGGAVPDVPELAEPSDGITSLWISQIDRERYHFIPGTEAMLDLKFSSPASYGASQFDLEHSTTGTGSWTTVFSTISSDQDNFSFNPGAGGYFRLLVHGGERDGQVSNVVEAYPPLLDTQFSGWGIGTDFGETGIMAPWVGHAQTAYVTVWNLDDGSDVYGGVSYQWYRVDPTTGNAVAIPGATEATYVTTEDDLGGYELFCRATGDGVTVGGFAQLKAFGPVVVFNRASATQVTRSGFTLNLHKSVASLAPDDLRLTYWGGSGEVVLPITAVTDQEGGAVFDISVEIPADVTGVNLENRSSVWRLGSQFGEGEWSHQMESLWIDLSAGGATDFSSWTIAMGLPGDRSGPLDRNGPLMIENLTAYAMGLDPMAVTPSDLPQVSQLDASAGSMHVTYRRAKNLTDATLAPRVSQNLADWVTADVVAESIIEDGGDWELVDATIHFPPGQRGFLSFAAELAEAP